MARKKVAILGGGPAAVTAAFELTRPERNDAYDVTLYQMGWRLGGKGASSRNPHFSDRIEEHGLHLWMGCYENAFRVMRACYVEDGLDWTKAFEPHRTVVLEEKHRGRWHHWPTTFPLLDTVPGESDEIERPLDLVYAMLRWAYRMLTPTTADDVRWGTPPAPLPGEALVRKVLRPLEKVFDALSAFRPAHQVAITWLRTTRAALWRLLGWRIDHNETRWFLLTQDFLLTNVIGILVEGFLIPPSGDPRDCTYEDWLDNVQRIDDEHYQDWLLRHGARKATTMSTIVRGLGDAVFNSNHEGSAAAALNGFVRLNLTFRGSVFFKMHAGMGETVFSPFYRVLAKRGVKFEFFHRVDGVRLDAERNVVAVDLARQVELKGGTYDPLVRSGELECWPHEPLWDQIATTLPAGVDLESPTPVPGETALTIEAGKDFDAVVLGIPVGALGPITAELSAADPTWHAMVHGMKTTPTQAVQLWHDETQAAMGWAHGKAVATGYAESLDTWCDMTHLTKVEGHGGGVKAVSYFVGSLTDSDPDLALARVTREADEWFDENLDHLLPKAHGHVVERYDRANVNPSDRYVLSVPGTGRLRKPSDRSGFGRLFLAGDWTRTGMNVGSVEASVMSGLRAARGITGDDVLIVGDFR